MSGTFGNDTITGGEISEVNGDVVDASSVTANITLTVVGAEAGTLSDGTSTVNFAAIESFILGSGNDTVIGTAGNESVAGGAGNDSMSGGAGNDSLDGGIGNDTLLGGTGDDVLTGGAGDDSFTLSGTFGNDTITGGETTETLGDTINASAVTANETLTFSGAETGTLTDGTSTTSFSQIEQFQLGSGNDTVIGGLGNDSVDGGAGNDTFAGGSGADTISTGVDADVNYGGANDVVVGGEGGNDNDTLILPGVDHITYGGGNNEAGTASFTDGSTMTFSEIDKIQVTGAVDGTSGNDSMSIGYTDAQGDIIDGVDGINDQVFGYAGNDSIDAGSGNDRVWWYWQR